MFSLLLKDLISGFYSVYKQLVDSTRGLVKFSVDYAISLDD